VSVVLDTLAFEFSDLGDAEALTRVVVRLLLAALLGGLLGLEREFTGKSAGLRTHMLVALGSAMFVVSSIEAGLDAEALSRVIQGLLAGVGFVCAGSILKSNDREQVFGLTTAAGLWMTAAIGVAAGLGRELLAVLSTLLTLGILVLEQPIQRRLDRRRRQQRVLVEDEAPRG
jgi:putative Mg2+ transporter-C (MgtC) family protein